MISKWTLILLIAVGAFLLLQERVELGFWNEVPGALHPDVAHSNAAGSSAFKCALLGTGPMSDGFRRDSLWRLNGNGHMGLACMDPALHSRPSAVASTD